MEWYKADMHIHTVLSPCGDLDMSPTRIIQEAKIKNLDIIGISDHNSTLHTELMVKLGEKEGIKVFPGVEVNTQEEIHCLAFFENIEKTKHFQQYLDSCMTGMVNNPDKFGMQLLVNEKEEILEEVEALLIAGINQSIDEVEEQVHSLNGVFIPAHVDRPVNGLYAQLGFMPPELKPDAIEIAQVDRLSEFLETKPELSGLTIITNSDAHFLHQIGEKYTEFYLQAPSFEEWKKALSVPGSSRIRTKL